MLRSQLERSSSRGRCSLPTTGKASLSAQAAASAVPACEKSTVKQPIWPPRNASMGLLGIRQPFSRKKNKNSYKAYAVNRVSQTEWVKDLRLFQSSLGPDTVAGVWRIRTIKKLRRSEVCAKFKFTSDYPACSCTLCILWWMQVKMVSRICNKWWVV